MSFTLPCWPPPPGVRVLAPGGEAAVIAAIAGAGAPCAEPRIPAQALAAAERLRRIHAAAVAPPAGGAR